MVRVRRYPIPVARLYAIEVFVPDKKIVEMNGKDGKRNTRRLHSLLSKNGIVTNEGYRESRANTLGGVFFTQVRREGVDDGKKEDLRD